MIPDSKAAIPDPIPLLADLEAEARRRGWERGGGVCRQPGRECPGSCWRHPNGASVVGAVASWWAPPDGPFATGHREPDPARRLDAALTAWATADAERLGWVKSAIGWWNAPLSYGRNNVNCVQGDRWWPPGRNDARNDAPDEPTAVRRALDAWLRARESVPAPAEADRPSSEGLPARCEGCDNAHVAHSESVWSHTCGEELPADLVARAKAAGLERVPAWATAYWHFPDTGAARVYSVGRTARAWVAWEVGEFASEADALRAWLDSREGAGRPAPRSGYAEAEQLRAKRDAATQEADRLRTRLVDAEAEIVVLRHNSTQAERERDEARTEIDALLAYLAYTGGCTHEGIGLPGCPTCEGRWSAEVRRSAHRHRDEADRLRTAHDAAVITAEESNDLLTEARSEIATIDEVLGLAAGATCADRVGAIGALRRELRRLDSERMALQRVFTGAPPPGDASPIEHVAHLLRRGAASAARAPAATASRARRFSLAARGPEPARRAHGADPLLWADQGRPAPPPPLPPRRSAARSLPSGGRVNVYIATRLENHAEHNRLRDRLRQLGVGLTYDWTTHGPVYDRGHEGIREVAALEAGGVIAADLVVALLPGGRGTHAEIGIALGAGRPVLVVPESRADIEGPSTCAFYHHPLVTIAAHRDLVRLAGEIAGVLARGAGCPDVEAADDETDEALRWLFGEALPRDCADDDAGRADPDDFMNSEDARFHRGGGD